MAGLLDPQDAALMALGSGLLGGGTFAQALGRGGQGFLSTFAAMQQAKEEKALKEHGLKMKEELQRAQIANYESEVESRKQQQALAQQKQAQIQGWLSEFTSPQAPIGAASSALSNGQGPTLANAANLPQPNRMDLIQRMAIAGAPGVSTLFDVEKWKADPLKLEAGATYKDRTTNQERTIPKLPEGGQMVGGMFSFLPGYQDSIANIEGAKTGAIERTKAGFDPVTFTPAGDSNPTTTTRGDLVNRMAPAGITTNMAGDPDAVRAQIRREMAMRPAHERDAVLAAYERQLAGGAGIKVQSKAEAVKAEEQAQADVKRAEEEKTKGNQFSDFKAQMKEARKLFAMGPTGSGFGSAVDSAAAIFGLSPSGAAEAKSLEALSGHMIQNIPKAPGAQSDAELRDYKLAAGQIGDRTIPIKQRLAAMNTVEQIVNLWEKRVGSGQTVGKTENTVDSLSSAPQIPADPAKIKHGEKYTLPNGEVGRWDSMKRKFITE